MNKKIKDILSEVLEIENNEKIKENISRVFNEILEDLNIGNEEEIEGENLENKDSNEDIENEELQLKEQEKDVIVPTYVDAKNPPLGKTEQVNNFDIAVSNNALKIYDNLSKKTKTYARIGNKYNITREQFNKDFDLNLDVPNYNKIIQKINEILTKYPDKAVSLQFPPFDLQIVIKNKSQVIEIDIPDKDEKEKPMPNI